MATRSAIIIQGKGKAELKTGLPRPAVAPDSLAIKPYAVALNPTDWKSIDFVGTEGAVSGCDYSGVVQAVGSDVKNGIRAGDRVAGWAHGCHAEKPEDGGFTDYIVNKAHMNFKIPDNVSFEEAATLPLGISTVGQGLYQALKLPFPGDSDTSKGAAEPILIYGGSTATGTLAIQFAKLSGYKVIATASPHNFDLVKSVGAEQVFDYKSPSCAADIKKATNDSLKLVFDTVATDDTAKLSAEAISSAGGHYSSLLPVGEFPRKDVESGWTLAYTALGETFDKYGVHCPANPKDAEFSAKILTYAGKLLAEGKLKPHPSDVRPGGLAGTLQGFQDMREGKYSGAKLVYKTD
ncbi:oxidoreductase-like protein [Xylona heveae TC161]|uniref:Oxidoreductase-like protein n=1 Tax=Xylona heveae (strain CBS 132557 / TC161) TaxID=1328760 RepID=A0A165A197_XYLHT|nr:oxidoreductase-like protein [Xylona heveae TC161]KZF19813.1 oxidoreductase-like protein [Xylona heveae TC161]